MVENIRMTWIKLRWSDDEYVWKNVSGVCGFVQQWQPGGIYCQTTVHVGGVLLLMNVQGFQHPSLPVVPFNFSCLGGLPIHLVLVGPSVGCHPIVGGVFLHPFLVLAWSYAHCSVQPHQWTLHFTSTSLVVCTISGSSELVSVCMRNPWCHMKDPLGACIPIALIISVCIHVVGLLSD